MKQKVLMFLVTILLVCIGVVLFLASTDKPINKLMDDETAKQDALLEKKTEKISCSSTMPPHCYLYRCNTGYVYSISLPAPGTNPLRCTDGSDIENVREVSDIYNVF